MVDVISDAELYLLKLETEIKNFKSDYESKTFERVFSNHVWMTTKIEDKLLNRTKQLKEKLVDIKDYYSNQFLKSILQFDAPINHCNEILNAINEILIIYKMRANLMDIKLRISHNLPIMFNNMIHLRNRFYILKGNVNRGIKIDEENLF